jgi:hypothetical protein
MIGTCPICPGSLAHKPGAYPQESNSPSLPDHRFADDMLSYGSNVSPWKHAAAPRSERHIGTPIKNDGLWHTMQAHDARNI